MQAFAIIITGTRCGIYLSAKKDKMKSYRQIFTVQRFLNRPIHLHIGLCTYKITVYVKYLQVFFSFFIIINIVIVITSGGLFLYVYFHVTFEKRHQHFY